MKLTRLTVQNVLILKIDNQPLPVYVSLTTLKMINLCVKNVNILVKSVKEVLLLVHNVYQVLIELKMLSVNVNLDIMMMVRYVNSVI